MQTREDFLLEPGRVTPKDHLIIVPLIWFAFAFSRPKDFASRLRQLGKILIKEWNQAFRHSKPGHRLPNEKTLALGEREFRNRVTGRLEKAQLRLSLNNYMFLTRNQQSVKPETLKLSDLRVKF